MSPSDYFQSSIKQIIHAFEIKLALLVGEPVTVPVLQF
jgi:hypothetical protein